jgi:hypothetical protein
MLYAAQIRIYPDGSQNQTLANNSGKMPASSF